MDSPATQDYLSLADSSSMAMSREVEIASAAGAGLDHPRRLYLERIRDGDVRRAVEAHTGDRYTQHLTGPAMGSKGSSSRFVFIQAAQNLDGGEAKWVTTDLFDTCT